MEFDEAAGSFSVEGKSIAVTENSKIAEVDWASHGVDVVCCCTVSPRWKAHFFLNFFPRLVMHSLVWTLLEGSCVLLSATLGCSLHTHTLSFLDRSNL